MNKRTLPSQATPRMRLNGFSWLLLAILLVFSFFCLHEPHTSKYSAFDRTWGFDHIAHYGIVARVLFFLSCLLLILPYSNNLLRSSLSWLADKLSGMGRKKVFIFLIVSGLSVFLFYLLKVKYIFLGDMNLRMIQTMKKEFLATEYLTMKALYTFAVLGAKFGYTHEQFFKVYSYLAGGLFIFLSFLIADLCGKTPLQKTLLFFSQLGSAVLLVFCGYVEVYATPILLLSLYFYCGLRYLKYNSGFVFVVLSLGLAIACHVLCLAALPSLPVAWYFKNKSRLSFISSMSNKKIALWLSVLIFTVLVISLKMKSGFLLTLSPPSVYPKLMTLFSFKHFWELFNGLLLSCGLSLIFIVILLAKSIREKKQLPAEYYFLISVSGCFLLLVFMANLQRGSGDWDIMAFPAVSLNLLTILLIAHLYKNETALSQYLMLAIIGLNSMHAFLWVHINHTDISIRKIDGMLRNDPGTYYASRINGLTQLALSYKSNKLMAESQGAALAACNDPAAKDLKPCILYGTNLKEMGKLDESIQFFEDLLKTRSPFVYEAYLFILEYYERKNNQVKFEFYLNMMFNSFIQNPDSFINSSNFRPANITRILEVLYIRTPKEDVKRLNQIRAVIDGVNKLKAPAKK